MFHVHNSCYTSLMLCQLAPDHFQSHNCMRLIPSTVCTVCTHSLMCMHEQLACVRQGCDQFLLLSNYCCC
jgi:hypothetical protein